MPIIIRFDVFKDTGLGHAPRHISLAVNQFHFERVEKARRDGIIVTGGSALHTPAQPMAHDQLLIALGTILAAPMGMNNCVRGKAAPKQRHNGCPDCDACMMVPSSTSFRIILGFLTRCPIFLWEDQKSQNLMRSRKIIDLLVCHP